MLKISAGPFLEVITNQGYDMQGNPEVQLTIEGNYELTQMQDNIAMLTTRLDTLMFERNEEDRLLATHPALKDLHDQYKIVYTLVKNADVNIGNDGNG